MKKFHPLTHPLTLCAVVAALIALVLLIFGPPKFTDSPQKPTPTVAPVKEYKPSYQKRGNKTQQLAQTDNQPVRVRFTPKVEVK